MTRELNCRDAGFDCDAVVRADSDEEVMAHDQQVRSQIRDA